MRFKRMSEIYSRMVDHTITNTTEVNDFSVGSAMRSIYESVSIELEQYYILTRENMQEAIERGVYESFGFERRGRINAFGFVQVTFHNPTQDTRIIPRGSRFISSSNTYPQIYETREDFLVPKGTLVTDVEVHCMQPGSYGNVPANIINTINSPIANVKEATNPIAFQTGQDEEPIEEVRTRFRSYIKTLSKATIDALEYGTREVEEVAGVYVHEEVGRVNIHAHDRNGELNDRLIEKIRKNLEQYRPAGIPIRIKPVERLSLDVDIVVVLSDKTANTEVLRQDITSIVTMYLNSRGTSQHLILSDLSRTIMNVDRQNIYDVEFKKLKENRLVKGHEVIRAGDIKVTLR